MSKFRNTATRTRTKSAVTAGTTADLVVEGSGATGFGRDAKRALPLGRVELRGGEHLLRERWRARRQFEKLVRQLAVSSGEWTAPDSWAGFVSVRTCVPQRSVVRSGLVHARFEAGVRGGNRQMISSVLQRPTEPGEMLATGVPPGAVPFHARCFAACNAGTRLYNERSLLKYGLV